MKKEKILETLIVLSAFFILVFLFSHKIYFVYAAFVLLLLGLFENPISEIIAKLWLSFSEFLGRISSFILLSIIFYFVLTPLAFLWRVFNKDRVLYFFDKSLSSFFKERNIEFSKEYFEKKW